MNALHVYMTKKLKTQYIKITAWERDQDIKRFHAEIADSATLFSGTFLIPTQKAQVHCFPARKYCIF